MTTDLFGEVPRRPRLWRMHVLDAGTAENGDRIARYQCTRCGAETDWQKIESVTASKRGIPCMMCNLTPNWRNRELAQHRNR